MEIKLLNYISMKNQLKIFVLSVILIIGNQLYAQDAEKTVTLTVSGAGKTQEIAKQSALKSAIEQTFGAFISNRKEILNDTVVLEQIASISSGNIKSFEILNESQLPDSTWGITLRTIVSINKLQSFVQAKGISVEIKGNLFAANIKQQLLNEQGEVKAIYQMISLLHEPMQLAYDYTIKSNDPLALDAESKNWEIPITVIAKANKNNSFCANYMIKNISAFSLTEEELSNYRNLNKQVFPIKIIYNGLSQNYYLRKENSLQLLKTFAAQWEFYINRFSITCDSKKFEPTNSYYNYHTFCQIEKDNSLTISYTSEGQIAAEIKSKDKKTLLEIEQLTGYSVTPIGIKSYIKNG
ncbi:MAG: hypothetical protein NTU43_04125, partial [Bacteroidetes bacterium]|nr:hypothetical protein [Bacteroidota bacterium]